MSKSALIVLLCVPLTMVTSEVFSHSRVLLSFVIGRKDLSDLGGLMYETVRLRESAVKGQKIFFKSANMC